MTRTILVDPCHPPRLYFLLFSLCDHIQLSTGGSRASIFHVPRPRLRSSMTRYEGPCLSGPCTSDISAGYLKVCMTRKPCLLHSKRSTRVKRAASYMQPPRSRFNHAPINVACRKPLPQTPRGIFDRLIGPGRDTKPHSTRYESCPTTGQHLDD